MTPRASPRGAQPRPATGRATRGRPPRPALSSRSLQTDVGGACEASQAAGRIFRDFLSHCCGAYRYFNALRCSVENPRKDARFPMNVADFLVQFLSRMGVRHAFGVGGANIEDIYDACHRSGKIEAILAKHEFSAATMADGYLRAGERLGVVLATSGGGAMNLVPALAEAFASRVPLLAIVGQTPISLEGRGGFQDSSGRAGSVNAVDLFSCVSRYCQRVESCRLVPAHVARRGRECARSRSWPLGAAPAQGRAASYPPPRRSLA